MRNKERERERDCKRDHFVPIVSEVSVVDRKMHIDWSHVDNIFISVLNFCYCEQIVLQLFLHVYPSVFVWLAGRHIILIIHF